MVLGPPPPHCFPSKVGGIHVEPSQRVQWETKKDLPSFFWGPLFVDQAELFQGHPLSFQLAATGHIVP